MTTSFNAAHVQVGAISCLVISVRRRIFDDPYECDLIRLAFEHRFRLPVVLIAQDARGCPAYRGRSTLVAALRAIAVTDLPWRRLRIR